MHAARHVTEFALRTADFRKRVDRMRSLRVGGPPLLRCMQYRMHEQIEEQSECEQNFESHRAILRACHSIRYTAILCKAEASLDRGSV